MTRKDYVAIAERFRQARIELEQNDKPEGHMKWVTYGYKQALDDMENDMAETFADDNPRFDHHRFKDACQLELDLQ